MVRPVVAAGVAVALLAPDATAAQPPDPARTERRLEGVRARSGQVALEVDALRAEESDVRAAITSLEGNVATQQGELDEAERAEVVAEAESAAAADDVVAARARIEALERQADAVLVEAFVNPPSDSALEGLAADTLSDVVVQQALTDIQADADADALDRLERAREDLEAKQAEKRAAADDAAARRREADAALADVANALVQQRSFGADVEERLDARLAEAQSLRTFDVQLAEQLEREEAEVARRWREAQAAAARHVAAEAASRAAAAARAEEARRAEAEAAARRAEEPAEPAPPPVTAPPVTAPPTTAPPVTAPPVTAPPVTAPPPDPPVAGGGGGWPAPSAVAPAPGGLATVSCPYGGSIQVAASIAGNLRALLDRAAAQGVSLCASSGWRSPDNQVRLRRQNCGTSTYAIYQMPSSSCNPPTARPGSSLHERGLAVDFSCNGGGAVRRGNSCWAFLAANAPGHGL
ncbi:MAG TPA: M15 family metallopeptidase, partial [Acidimicrobiales bacterium]|nr:M15 family metallopeptidase [Acidimicrobiales bacterium]